MKRQISTTICMLLLLLSLARCSQIDWMDFIRLNGITYYSDFQNDPLIENNLSPYGEITHKVDGNVSCQSYRIKNGDAAFIEKGTTVYSIASYAPTFRLAAKREGKWFIYEGNNPQAKKGSEWLDIDGKVEYIGINSYVDGTELASIKEQTKVGELVRMILEASIDPGNSKTGSERYFLKFHLIDGTTSVQNLWLDTRMLGPIQLPEVCINNIKAALEVK